jgi:predicted dithiol-disulfide oxidoreductase (DUF899 family)
MTDPQVVSREEWLAARTKLLGREKELTHLRDEINAERRRLPMVEIDKDYVFQGPDGEARLLDMFEGRRQLLVWNFMFHPDWDAGCPSCSLLIDNVGHLSHLHSRNTTLAAISRAPYPKLAAYRERMGWSIPWYSSHGSDFNYDFHATLDPSVAPVEYNFQPMPEAPPGAEFPIEGHAVSAFLRRDDGGSEDKVFHTYTSYARGGDILIGTYNWLDLTALGRQEEWEQPADRTDGETFWGFQRHDEY